MTFSRNPKPFIHVQAFASPLPPKVGAVCLNRARTDLCGGRRVISVPTAIRGYHGLGMEKRNGSNSEGPMWFGARESNLLAAQRACGRGASRCRRSHARGDVLCTEPGRPHPCPV